MLRNFEAALAKEGFRTLTVAHVSTLPQLQDQHLSRAYFGAFRLDRGGAPALYVNIAVAPNGDEPRSDLVIVQEGRAASEAARALKADPERAGAAQAEIAREAARVRQTAKAAEAAKAAGTSDRVTAKPEPAAADDDFLVPLTRP